MTLVVLDLDHTLVDTYTIGKNIDNAHSDDFMYDHIYEVNDNLVKISVRPYVFDFLEKLIILGVKLAIYSKGSSYYVNKCIEIVFYKIPWVFIWTRDNIIGDKKDLRLITEKYPEYNENNLILLDDQQSICDYNRQMGYKCLCVKHYDITRKYSNKLFSGDHISSYIHNSMNLAVV